MMAEQFQDIISCPICLDEYREPKALPCLHTFCKTCLLGLLTTYIKNSSQDEVVFLCPVCRKHCGEFNINSPEVWINQLPSNHLIVSVKDKVIKQHPYDKVHNLCPEHEKVFEYFCEDHIDTVCSKCIIQCHRHCQNIIDIELAWKIEETECTELATNIDEQLNWATDMMNKKAQQRDRIERQSNVICKTVADMRESIITAVLEMESNLNEEVQIIKTDEIETITKSMERIRREIRELEKKKRKIIEIRMQSKGTPIIKSYRNMNKEVKDIGKELEKQNLIHTFEIAYHKNTDLTKSLTKNGLGELLLEKREDRVKVPKSQSFARERQQSNTNTSKAKSALNPKATAFCPKIPLLPKLQLHKNVSVLTSKDKSQCYITGAAFLPDATLVLSDHDNGKIKVFDKDYRLRSEMGFNSDPWDVTLVVENQIAVSFPDDNLIQILIYQDNNLNCGLGIFRTKGRCYGMSSCKEELAVCVRNKTESFVEVFNFITRELLWVWKSGQASVTSGMWYITFDTSGQDILVTDETNGCITCISRNYHDVEWTVDVPGARGITLHNNYILLTSRKSTSIKCISLEDQSFHEVPVNKENVMCPDVIAHDQRNNRLIISEMGENIANRVKIFTTTN